MPQGATTRRHSSRPHSAARRHSRSPPRHASSSPHRVRPRSRPSRRRHRRAVNHSRLVAVGHSPRSYASVAYTGTSCASETTTTNGKGPHSQSQPESLLSQVYRRLTSLGKSADDENTPANTEKQRPSTSMLAKGASCLLADTSDSESESSDASYFTDGDSDDASVGKSLISFYGNDRFDTPPRERARSKIAKRQGTPHAAAGRRSRQSGVRWGFTTMRSTQLFKTHGCCRYFGVLVFCVDLPDACCCVLRCLIWTGT